MAICCDQTSSSLPVVDAIKDTTTMLTQCPCTPTKVAGAPVSKFTVSYATQTFHPHTYVRTDMEEQLAAVKAHEAQRRAARMQHIERESTISEMNRRVGVKLLLRTAAQRDMALGQCTGYDNGVQKFMWQTWNAFLVQANEFLSAEGADVAVDGTPAMCSRAALENASSIGLWFNGPCLSLPLRRYAVQVENAGGQLETLVLVGLVSFSYSSYIMQLRMGAQTIILDEMQRMNTQLETACLFSPQLLIA